MNAKMDTQSATQVDNSEMRPITHTEQVLVSGGAPNSVCYRNPKGRKNSDRHLRSGNHAIYQKWDYRYRKYVEISRGYTVAFRKYCFQKGFNYIY
jgi:hypothetical protein